MSIGAIEQSVAGSHTHVVQAVIASGTVPVGHGTPSSGVWTKVPAGGARHVPPISAQTAAPPTPVPVWLDEVSGMEPERAVEGAAALEGPPLPLPPPEPSAGPPMSNQQPAMSRIDARASFLMAVSMARKRGARGARRTEGVYPRDPDPSAKIGLDTTNDTRDHDRNQRDR